MINWNLGICIALLFNMLQLSAQNFNRPVPADIPPYEFIRYDTNYYGYYMTAPFQLGAASGPSGGIYPKPTMILDSAGYLFWYMPVYSPILLDFKYHPAQQVFSFINYKSPDDIRFTLMDTDFQVIDSFTTVNGIRPDLHELTITANQTYLLSGVYDTIMDLSAYLFNGNPGNSQTSVIGFAVQEFDEAHQLLFQWKSTDHIHPTRAYDFYGYAPAHFDYAHGNAIWEDDDGGLLLSFRTTNGIYKINRTSGDVEWELGGKNSSFTFVNDNGFSAQHDIRRLPNGNVSLFDNANMAPLIQISRALEYSLDTVNWVATKVWEYRHDPAFFSFAMGNHQTTGNRQHLVNYGMNFQPNPTFVLADDNKNVLSELFFQDSFVVYRSFIFDLPLQQIQRPPITCTQNVGSVTLSAPPGFERYTWSTGETGSSITVDETGTYMLWVNHGAGMLGSEPFILDDLNTACQASSAASPESIENQEIIGYYDLLGRQVSWPVRGNLYVIRYKNGAGRLQFWNR